ncbi:hypothetical protein RND71_043073 [Anisodus tanguticus]|uniref:Uncharacterized protein n=1 Tax=Anisodus tanguticus TaxID=243964 RepID=A0AAE1QS74_9SOLA|nr:hypothetical protein RND71_043073 [Anisodus tanguticus]
MEPCEKEEAQRSLVLEGKGTKKKEERKKSNQGSEMYMIFKRLIIGGEIVEEEGEWEKER